MDAPDISKSNPQKNYHCALVSEWTHSLQPARLAFDFLFVKDHDLINPFPYHHCTAYSKAWRKLFNYFSSFALFMVPSLMSRLELKSLWLFHRQTYTSLRRLRLLLADWIGYIRLWDFLLFKKDFTIFSRKSKIYINLQTGCRKFCACIIRMC